MLLSVTFMFFFKQKAAYELRISDWSSDVCSSDLCDDLILATGTTLKVFFGSTKRAWQKEPDLTGELPSKGSEIVVADLNRDAKLDLALEIGRAACRERGCQDV